MYFEPGTRHELYQQSAKMVEGFEQKAKEERMAAQYHLQLLQVCVVGWL